MYGDGVRCGGAGVFDVGYVVVLWVDTDIEGARGCKVGIVYEGEGLEGVGSSVCRFGWVLP